jgi:hypothetical protein
MGDGATVTLNGPANMKLAALLLLTSECEDIPLRLHAAREDPFIDTGDVSLIPFGKPGEETGWRNLEPHDTHSITVSVQLRFYCNIRSY